MQFLRHNAILRHNVILGHNAISRNQCNSWAQCNSWTQIKLPNSIQFIEQNVILRFIAIMVAIMGYIVNFWTKCNFLDTMQFSGSMQLSSLVRFFGHKEFSEI